jgi:hypothetical protein
MVGWTDGSAKTTPQQLIQRQTYRQTLASSAAPHTHFTRLNRHTNSEHTGPYESAWAAIILNKDLKEQYQSMSVRERDMTEEILSNMLCVGGGIKIEHAVSNYDAECIGMLHLLSATPSSANIIIYTDSLSLIHSLHSFLSARTDRQRLRTESRPWLQMMMDRLRQRQEDGGQTIIRHVKAHTETEGLVHTGNRLADRAANEYRENSLRHRKTKITQISPVRGERFVCLRDDRERRWITNDVRREAKKRFTEINKERWMASESQSLMVTRNKLDIRNREERERRRQQSREHQHQLEQERQQEMMDRKRVEAMTAAWQYVRRRKIEAVMMNLLLMMSTDTLQYVKVEVKDAASQKTERQTMQLCCHKCPDWPILTVTHILTCPNRERKRRRVRRRIESCIRNRQPDSEDEEERQCRLSDWMRERVPCGLEDEVDKELEMLRMDVGLLSRSEWRRLAEKCSVKEEETDGWANEIHMIMLWSICRWWRSSKMKGHVAELRTQTKHHHQKVL